jgi:hypothetical protein
MCVIDWWMGFSFKAGNDFYRDGEDGVVTDDSVT